MAVSLDDCYSPLCGLTHSTKDPTGSASSSLWAYLLFTDCFLWLRSQYQGLRAFPTQFHYLVCPLREDISLIFNTFFFLNFLQKTHHLMQRKVKTRPHSSPAHMHAKSLQSCLPLCNPVVCRPPGSSVHRILQARILEWVAMPFSRESSQPRDWTRISYVSCTGRQVLYH